MIADSELTQIVRNVEGISVTPRKCFLFKVKFIKDFNSFALYLIVYAQCLILALLNHF